MCSSARNLLVELPGYRCAFENRLETLRVGNRPSDLRRGTGADESARSDSKSHGKSRLNTKRLDRTKYRVNQTGQIRELTPSNLRVNLPASVTPCEKEGFSCPSKVVSLEPSWLEKSARIEASVTIGPRRRAPSPQ